MLLISFVSALVVSVATIVYTGITQANNNERINQVITDNNRQWCELLSPLDKAYSSGVPSTELGKVVANAIHRIHDKFEC